MQTILKITPVVTENHCAWASQVVLVVKNPHDNAGRRKIYGFNPWVWTRPWRRAQQPTPVFLLERERSLMGYGPECRKK